MEALTLVRSWRSRTWSSASPSPCRGGQRYGGGRSVVAARASGGRDHHRWGRLVDENMIVLRLRLREMKKMMMEEEEEEEEEEDYGVMKWEREYYEGEYGEHVCEALGLLQSYLMNVRPCLAVGIVFLLAFSLFTSSGLLLFNSINTMKTLFPSSLFGFS